MTYARWAAVVLAAAMVVLAAALFVGLPAATSVGSTRPPRDVPPVAPLGAAGEAPVSAAGLPAPAPGPVAAPERVRIPAIGVDGPLIPLGLNPDRTLAVPKKAKIAGWYTGAPKPGEVGPAIVVGHVDLDGAAGVFQRLHQLRPGDQVEFRAQDTVTATYVVTHTERVAKEAFPTAKVYGDTPGPELRLITCGGVFDNNSGHYRDNVIVYAKAVR
ncbi:MAG: class F sortase [Nitriliruptorales bacterium]